MQYPKTKVPTEPGLYWFRFDDKQPWLPIEAFIRGGELMFQRRGYSACLASGLKGDKTEYRGPIPEPEDITQLNPNNKRHRQNGHNQSD